MAEIIRDENGEIIGARLNTELMGDRSVNFETGEITIHSDSGDGFWASSFEQPDEPSENKENMIEKAARAMKANQEEAGGGYCASSEIDWELAAKAALIALMEPTDGMIIADMLNVDRRTSYEEALKAALDGK